MADEFDTSDTAIDESTRNAQRLRLLESQFDALYWYCFTVNNAAEWILAKIGMESLQHRFSQIHMRMEDLTRIFNRGKGKVD